MPVMIRKVYMNGQVSTLLVFEDNSDDTGFNPILEALKEQAERIESLEEQNRELVKQEELLASLMEMTAQTGELMSRSLKALERLEDNKDIEDLPEGSLES
jgi:hypothetical protein